ncbi:MAG: FadD3 family acyl-CoA ligase [Jatrophihabitans sp.]|uniref:FadD3 family acyl-CoA ligase n=1 Tax=Jatrophihabitans sp. TaxID=1932789 RepID=UPI003F80C5F7
MDATIPAALDRAADGFTGEALVDGEVRLTWPQLRAAVLDLARYYVARGVRPGDRVAVWAPNTHHWVVAALGVHWAGATLVPVNTRYTGHEAHDILVRTRAVALVVCGPFLGTDRLAQLCAAGATPDLRAVLRIPTDDSPAPDRVDDWTDVAAIGADVPVEEVAARAAAVRADDVSDILFTSGTTGRSKGVLSAHRQVLAVAAAWAECGEVTDRDRYLVINPFFHSFGYKAGIVVCLLTGATIVPQAVYDVPEAMRLIAAERVSVLPGAPTIFQTILDSPEREKFDLSSLRLAVTGAAVVPVALVERMQQELSLDLVLTAFGMTEAVVVTMCRRDDPAGTVARTCGRAVAGCEIRIGEQDELLVRGPNVMLGYLDDAEATAVAIDADGWLHTGDVGVIDATGHLRITDRLKDMYISGGFNVYPAEVEQTLARLDGVADAAVIGVPDARLGEVGLALVVRRDETVDEHAVIAFCRERLANFKVPRQVRFVDTLPRNLAGKLLKTDLRRVYG